MWRPVSEIVVIDNYDSFTWNVVELLARLGARSEVIPNDRMGVDELCALPARGFVVSPGPCTPADSGVSLAVVERAVQGRLGRPLLGVCLGHQALGITLGGRLVRGLRPEHGKTTEIGHDGRGVFADLPQQFVAGRYNSLVIERGSLGPEGVESAWSPDGEIMGLRHASLPIEGIQFHPESHLTPLGERLLRTWLASLGQ